MNGAATSRAFGLAPWHIAGGAERAQVLKFPFWPPRPREESLCVAFQRSPVPSFSLGTLAPLAEQTNLPYLSPEKPLVTEQDLPHANPVRSALHCPSLLSARDGGNHPLLAGPRPAVQGAALCPDTPCGSLHVTHDEMGVGAQAVWTSDTAF